MQNRIGLAALVTAVVLLVVLPPLLVEPRSVDTDAGNDQAAVDADGMSRLPGAVSQEFRGDLDEMRERKLIRALVVPSLTDFFSLEGRILGIQAELLQNLEDHINRDVQRDELKTRIVYVPVSFSELIPALAEGRGDIAAAILTRTADRESQIRFAGSVNLDIDEVLVHADGVSGIETIDDLSGRNVYVLRDSSYAEHLRELNESFAQRGLEPANVIEADPHLTTEDILELVNAGLVEMTIADDYKATLWSDALDDIEVRHDIVLRENTSAGWAVRDSSLQLARAIDEATRQVRKGTLLGNIFIERYFGSTRWIENPLVQEDRERFARHADLFRKYGERYDFDWIALMAQAYQESGLDHGVESPAGAIGIMQLLPSTASDPNVGIENIDKLENNVHAGAKYMAFLQQRYFASPELDDMDRLAFTWAAYNAGPRKVRLMREHARASGFDPDQWFGNVEYAALDIIGQETVRYVANIYKYYVAYRLSEDLLQARKSARTIIHED